MPKAKMLKPRQPLHELIQASWQRCRHHGMSPHWHVDQILLTQPELHLQREENRQLRKLALREMRLLESSLAYGGRVLILTDSTGVILDSLGDDTFLGRTRKVSLMPGASWREQITGTNAIGIAVVEHCFVQVLGSQHFFYENQFLACNAMPIFSPAGHLAGVLNISGDVTETFSSAGRVLRHAVAHIEHDWVAESATDLVVRLHQHPSWLGTPEEGILAFQDDLLTGANSRALIYLGLTPLAIGRAQWRDIFQHVPTYGPQELRLLNGSGIYYADLAPAHSASSRIATTELAHSGPANFEDLKDEALRHAIAAENGNISAAARKLGIHRSTFYRRLNRDHSKSNRT